MTTGYTSMSYKDIAREYNAINALPPLAASQIGDAIARRVVGDRLLDLGGGAGRLGIPAAWAGCHVVALDLEAAMLRAGVLEAESLSVMLASTQADVTCLPYADKTFDAVMINNVLHLVPRWEEALVETARVLRPGGVLILGRDWLDPDSFAAKIRGKWRQIVGMLDPAMRPTSAAGPALFQTVARMGGRVSNEAIAAEWSECLSPARILERMRARRHNETWSLDEAVLSAGLPQLENWAQEQWPDTRAEEQVCWRFMLSTVEGLHGF